MDTRVKLPYLRARAFIKDLATPPSSPDVGTIARHRSPGKLRPFTKEMTKEDPMYQTVYVGAVSPTSYCSHDIWEETSEHLMQVKASRSDNTAQIYNHRKIGYQKVDTNSQDVPTLVRLLQSRKTPSN